MKTASRWPQSIVATLGALGYVSCTLQWLWLGILFLPSLLDSQKDLLLPSAAEPLPAATFDFGGSSLLMTGVGIAVTLIVLVISVVILARLPLSIAKTGNKATRGAAEVVLPIVSHHKKLPAKKRRQLAVWIAKVVKLALVIAPVKLLAITFLFEAPLPQDLIFMIGSILAISSIIWFSLEYLVAGWLKVPADRIL